MDFGWTEEERMWRKAVHDFAQKKIAPRVREIDDTSNIPQDIIKAMADMGLWAPTVSEKYGGSGLNVTMATIAAEELGRADISLALPVMYLVQASWAFVFERYASEELGAKRIRQALDALDRYVEFYRSGSDELYYLYGLAYEQDTPYRDIKQSYAYYKRVRDEYPRSLRWKAAAERVAFMERHYYGLR